MGTALFRRRVPLMQVALSPDPEPTPVDAYALAMHSDALAYARSTKVDYAPRNTELGAQARVVKTPKGADEIKTRASHLPQRMRVLLILVDGQLTVGELAQRCLGFGDARSILLDLIEGGYVQATPSSPPAVRDCADLACELTALAHVLDELLGPAAQTYTSALANASSAYEFLDALARAAFIVKLHEGGAKAAEFEERGKAVAHRYAFHSAALEKM